jgi:acyl-CoA thioesterase I
MGVSRPMLIGMLAWIAASTFGCASRAVPNASEGSTASDEAGVLRYVALGDSYTIGTSVGVDERFPNQLVARLSTGAGASAGPDRPVALRLVANLGVNGFTSRDVIEEELPKLDDLHPEFVTVLIGVNDVVQGVDPETYRVNTARILDTLLALVPANRIVAVSTPDYTVTPQGAAYGDPAQQSAGIRADNDILKMLAEARAIAFVDIYDLSLRAATDPSLVAADGLHPSGAQYALWADRISPVVEGLLNP